MNKILLQLIIVSFKVVYSENSCWWTRCEKNNISIKPDNLQCLDVDVNKMSIFKTEKEGIYICDLCPYFPHKRFVDVSLSKIPSQITSNVKFPECFGLCFDKVDCVALSYDHSNHSCYTFNNTIGTLVTREKYTTVIMTQPVGVLQNWTYSRHISLTGDIFNSSKENNFQTCLSKCNKNNVCNYISYSIKTSNCSMFSSKEQVKYTYLNYGHISAFKITSLPAGNDAISRFSAEGDDLYITENVKEDNNDECSSFKNVSHSAFYSKACLTSGGIGCNSTTGCKLCYYPENVNEFINLDKCPDRDWVALNKLKQTVQKKAGICLKNTSCIGIGFNSNTKELDKLTFNNFASNDYSTRFMLTHPTEQSVDQILMTKFDFMFNYDLIQISNNTSSFQETVVKTLQACLNLFQSNNNYIRMSYSNNKCKVFSEEVKYVFKIGDFVIAFKKPALTSPLLNYGRTPGFVIPVKNAKNTYDQCRENCDEICAQKCNNEFKDWCSHFSIQQDVKKGTCFFFEILNDMVLAGINLEQMDNGQIFIKLSSLDFSLESLNKLNPFQASDIYNCFLPKSEEQQTETSSTRLQISRNQDTGAIFRRKRGLFNFLKNTFKSVFKCFAKVVTTVSDNAIGIAKSIGHLVTGNLKKAKEAIVNIPVVKDVKNVIKLGKAVVTGDWKQVKKRGIDFLESSTLDAVVSVIPVTSVIGKVVRVGIAAAPSIINEIAKRKFLRKEHQVLISILPKKNESNLNDTHDVGKNNKLSSRYMNKNKMTNVIDGGERNQCKKRLKRTTRFWEL